MGPPVLLTFIIIGFFWRLTLTSQFTWLESPDMANQVMPWQQVQAAAFHQGKFPLWDPYLWGGQSLIGQAQPGTAYPFNWILYAMPLRDGHIHVSHLNWYMALLHVFPALFCFWLCRDLGRSRMASLIAGAAFALAGVVGTVDWPQMLNGAVWAPLVLMFLLRAVSGRQPFLSAALAGFFLGMSWLSGHHQIPIFLLLAFAGVWIFYVFRGNKLNWNVLGLAAVFAVFLGLASAFQVLPAAEYGRLAVRWVSAPWPVGWKEVVPYSVHREYSLGLPTLFGIVVPGMHRQADPYTGFVILSLAVLGVALGWSDLRVRLLSVLSLGGLFLSLGAQNVFHGFLYSVLPLVEKARTPAMAVVIFNFGVAVLTAFGLDGLRDHRESAWPRRIARWLAWAGAVMLALMLGVMMSKQLGFDYDDRIVLVAVLGLLMGALYLGYEKGNLGIRALGISCLLLLLLDVGNVAAYYYPHKFDKNRAVYLSKFSENQDLLEWLRRQPGPFRVQIDSHDIAFNYGDWYGIEEFGGYTASVPASLARLGWDEEGVRNLYGTRYWVGRGPRTADQAEVFTAQSGVKVYQSALAFPRVWTVHQAVAVRSENQIVPAFEDPNLDLRHTALFLGEAPKLSTCGGDDRATLLKSDFDSVAIQADMKCAGLVVLSDNYFPGWTATVDGKPAKIWEAYTVIRGVEVGPGRHQIEMRYRPLSVIVGAWMLAMSLVGLGALAWWERRRQPTTA